jgi:phage gp29-like protein
MKALRYVSDIVRMTINSGAIPDLVRYNYGPNVLNFPELRVRRIGEAADWRAFSVAMRNLVEPGILTPTPDLEQWVRDQMDLPLGGDDVTERDVEERTQQAPVVAPPEQPAAQNGQVPKKQNADGSRQGSREGGPKE